MHVTSLHTGPMRVLGALVGIACWASAATTEAPAAEKNMWTVSRPVSVTARRPLGRLVRNPDTSDGSAAYALADQSGTVQRFVEPVPGIDLEPYVGYVVIIKHDTGRTLLASQLELPGAESDQVVEPSPEPAHVAGPPANRLEALLGHAMAPVEQAVARESGKGQILPAQYVQGPYVQGQYAQGQYPQNMMPMMQGGMQPVMIQQGGPPMMQGGTQMMTPQGVVPLESTDPSMAGAEWGPYPQGAGPIYLDGPPPQSCGPDGCSTCTPYGVNQPMMMGGQYFAPNACQTCQPMPG